MGKYDFTPVKWNWTNRNRQSEIQNPKFKNYIATGHLSKCDAGILEHLPSWQLCKKDFILFVLIFLGSATR
jgi:hypothetical protein